MEAPEGFVRQQVARLQLQGRQQSPAWPPKALERGVLELAEHFCSFAATWRGLSPSGLGPAGQRELLGLVSKLLQRARSKLLKITTAAGEHCARTGRAASPALFHTVLECLQALLAVPAVCAALNAQAPRPAAPSGGPHALTAAHLLLETLLYQRLGCSPGCMHGGEDTADLLDALLRQVLLACPLHSLLALLALGSPGGLHLKSELLQPEAGEEAPPCRASQSSDAHSVRCRMNELLAQALHYLAAQMPLIHRSLPLSLIAEPLNARLLALRGSDEGQPGLPHKLWGGLRVALSAVVHALTQEGAYLLYAEAKEVLGVPAPGAGMPPPLILEMRLALKSFPKQDPSKRLQQILRCCIYQDTERAAMLALHDFQVQHWEWLEGHMAALPPSRFKLLLEHLLRTAAGARRVEPTVQQVRPLSPTGNYANANARLAGPPHSSRLPKPPPSQPSLPRPRTSPLPAGSAGRSGRT